MKMKQILSSILVIFLVIGVVSPVSAAQTPKCKGQSLTSYKKNLSLYNKAYSRMKYYDEYTDEYPGATREQIRKLQEQNSELRLLSYRIWLDYGYALSKYAKICKVKMPKEWQEMLDSTPDR
jgi:hypothetical protein